MSGTGKSRLGRRFGVFGDLHIRFLRDHALRIIPWFLEPVLVAVWTFVFFMLAKKQRQAVAENLQALHPQWGRWRGRLGAWQVFWNFGLTYADALRCQTQTGGVDWALDGIAAMEDVANRKQGCIILTAHMGNYDLAAPLFAASFKRTLYTVRAEEREPETQKAREEEIRKKEQEFPLFKTLYNREGSMLAIELAKLLAEGNLIAVQGDRVVFEVTPMDVEVEPGLVMRLPKGPFFLARATAAPTFPLFIVREGWRRYRVIVLPEINLPLRSRGADQEAAELWATTLLGECRKHWKQWYVFEPLFVKQ